MKRYLFLIQLSLLLIISQFTVNITVLTPVNVNMTDLTSGQSKSLNENSVNKILSTSFQTKPILSTQSMTGSWQELGPTPLQNPNNVFTWGSAPYSGRVTAIAVNGSNPQEIYVGSASGGVWKTLDGGSHWVPLMDQQNSLAVGAITIAPDNHTLYVGTGEPNHGGDNYAGIGLLKSTNEGQSFTILGASYFSNSSISSIIVTKSNPNYILVSTTWATYAKGLAFAENLNGIGIFLSTNGGSSWSHTLSSPTDGVANMVVNATNDNNIFAGDFNGYVWESVTAGASWTQYMYYSTAPADQGRVAIAVTPAAPNIIYIVFVNSTGEVIWMGATDGTNFATFTNLPVPTSNQYGPCGGQCWYNLLIAVDPTNYNNIYVGTNNLYKSIDGGATWTFLGGAEGNGNLHPDQHAFAFSPSNPSTIYSGNDGGIYKSTTGGSSWSSLNTNLGTIQFDSIAASPTNDAHLVGGAQDNACDMYTNSTSWAIGASGDGAASMFYNDTTFACNYVNLDFRATENNGLSFFEFNTGINQNDPTEFYAPMAQDPSNPWTTYLGSNRIYKLTSSDTQWNDVSGQISNGAITTIAVAKSNGNTLYEGDNLGVVKASNTGGTTWGTVFDSYTFYSKHIAITSVAVDPIDSNLVFWALANQSNPRLFYSPDQGTSVYYFNLVGVPNVAINVIKINPVTDVLFIGTDQGLYYLDNSLNWNHLGAGLPNAPIWDLTFTKSNYLVVGTHGRGAWLNYMTPFVTLDSSIGSYQSGKQVSITISDPNGFTNATYNWDSSSNSTASASFSTSIPSSEGIHTLNVYARDPAGNWAHEQFVFRTDNTAPVIALSGISNNAQINTGSTVQLTVSDASPIQSVLYSWNNGGNSSTSISGNSISITAPSSTGQASLQVYAEDSAGNWGMQTYSFTITLNSQSQTSGTNGQNTSNISSGNNTITSAPGFELVTVFVLSLVLFSRKKEKKS